MRSRKTRDGERHRFSRRASSKREAFDPEDAEKGAHHWVHSQMLGVRAQCAPRAAISSTACDDQITCTRFFFGLVGARLETRTKESYK